MGYFNDLIDYLSGASEQQQLDALEQSSARYEDINLPDISPLQHIAMGSEFGNIQEDPQLRQAQLEALMQQRDIVQQGGLTATDRARIEEINQIMGQQNRAERDAIVRNAQLRGVGGSGIELASQMQAQQSGATRRSMGGFDVARAGEQRALQAIMNQAQLGGQIRGQDYGIASNKASALDAINKFNLMNKMNVGQYNRGLQQQQFQNQMQQAGGMQQGDLAKYGYYGGKAQRGQQNLGDVLSLF